MMEDRMETAEISLLPLTIHDWRVAQLTVTFPAALLMLTGITQVLASFVCLDVLVSLADYLRGSYLICFAVALSGLSCLTLAGGILMRLLKCRVLVVIASILAIVLPPFLPGIITGIWALVSLRDPLVKRAFSETVLSEENIKQ